VTLAPVVVDRDPQPAPQLCCGKAHATFKPPVVFAVIGADCPASSTREEDERLAMPPPTYPPEPHPDKAEEKARADAAKQGIAFFTKLRSVGLVLRFNTCDLRLASRFDEESI
jgi:hypothetical protein